MPWTHPHPQKGINGAAEQTNEQRRQKNKTNKQNKQTDKQESAGRRSAPDARGHCGVLPLRAFRSLWRRGGHGEALKARLARTS
jgi:hypothetical protein